MADQVTPKRAHLLRLTARNIKTLRAVEIDEFGAVTEIRGDAGQGKTSLLEAIEGGLRGLDPSMVRQGEDAAEIVLELDVARIQRIVQANGGKDILAVSAQGKPVENAKAFLKALLPDSTAFRPLDFVQLGGGDSRGRTERLRQQRNMLLDAMPVRISAKDAITAIKDLGEDILKEATGVDIEGVDWEQHALSVCASLEAAFYERRKSVNHEAESAEAKAEAYPAPAKAAPQASEAKCREMVDEATRKLYGAEAAAKTNEATVQRRAALTEFLASAPAKSVLDEAAEQSRASGDAYSKAQQLVASLREQLTKAEREAEQARQEYEAAEKTRARVEADVRRAKEAREELAQIEGTSGESAQDIDQLRSDLDKAKDLLEGRIAQDKHDAAVKEALEKRARAGRFDALVRLFRDQLPAAIVNKMKMPVEGLGIADGVVVLNGVPLHQLGTSEQLRVAIQLAAALNPSTGFVLVDRAESLGTKDRAALAGIAKELDLQLVLTFVDPGATPAPGTVVMREGERVQ